MLKKIVKATLNAVNVIAPEDASNALEVQTKKAEQGEVDTNDDKAKSN